MKVLINGLIAVLLVTIVFSVSKKFPVNAEEEGPIVLTKVVYKEPTTPEEYINYKFGDDAPKAFLLLRGKGPGTCAENRDLKWDAQNYNDDKKKSVDIGIFQVNEYWHKINRKWLYNWKINIDVAYQLYTENGNSFKLWTCGKTYGI